MKSRFWTTVFAALAVTALFASGSALAQRARTIAPFSEPLRCEWVTRSSGNAWTGTHIWRVLVLRNTLQRELPVGTRIAWTYRQYFEVTGEMTLSAPLRIGASIDTTAWVASQQGMTSCSLLATYGQVR